MLRLGYNVKDVAKLTKFKLFIIHEPYRRWSTPLRKKKSWSILVYLNHSFCKMAELCLMKVKLSDQI